MSKEKIYLDKTKSIEKRVEDLLARMNLKQKIGQMYQGNARSSATVDLLREWEYGSMLQVSGQKALDFQKIACEETELGIPILFGIDAIHGHNQWKGATVFPTQLTLGCSWNPELGKKMAAITAKEMSYTGVHWTFSPAAELVRDLRWGRCDEAFSEDTLLSSQFVKEMVEGYQGDRLSDPHSVLACIKHFAGYCETVGGRDSSEGDISKRKLLSTFLPVFEPAVRAGAATIMIGYNAIDGEPCNTNKWLLTDVLNSWGFKGITITDWNNVGSLVDKQFTCKDYKEAAILSIEAGMNMCMNTPEFLEAAYEAAQNKEVDLNKIDASVRKILKLKFELGLFDDQKYFNMEEGKKVWACKEHKEAALKLAEESIVLLKNENSILPLTGKKKIALIGSNAGDDFALLGDWSRINWNTHEREQGETSSGHPKENIITVLDALKNNSEIKLEYTRGCGPLDSEEDENGFADALTAAKNSDAVIITVGDDRSKMGECYDICDIKLSGNQEKLLNKIAENGIPIILLFIASKPLDITDATQKSDAVICAFNPGMQGGQAIADLIFGKKNFHGKLAATFPRSLGQQPAYYQQIAGWHTAHPSKYGYIDEKDPTPLYPFGFGLSYTNFSIDNISLSSTELKKNDNLIVKAKVSNTGEVDGVEVVQVYVNDIVSSLTTPIKELKGFCRVELKAGESKEIEIEIPYNSLSLINRDLDRVVEAGDFELMIGNSSADKDLQKFKFSVLN